jgi:hypothetical protein
LSHWLYAKVVPALDGWTVVLQPWILLTDLDGGRMVTDFRSILRNYDRKERAWLVRNFIGRERATLCPKFCEELTSTLGLSPPITSLAWWGIDFHLEWLEAALSERSLAVKRAPRNTIQDIDFIVAEGDQVVLIEVKGFRGWDNAPLGKKMKRLGDLPVDNAGYAHVAATGERLRFHFALMSPRPLAVSRKSPAELRLKLDGWPEWALRNGRRQPFWIKLKTEPLAAMS